MQGRLLVNPNSEAAELRRERKTAHKRKGCTWTCGHTGVLLSFVQTGLLLVVMIAILVTDPFAPVARMERTTGSMNEQMTNMTRGIESFVTKLPKGQLELTTAEIFDIVHNVKSITEKAERIIGTVPPATIISLMNYITHITGQFSELLNTRHNDGSGRTILTDAHELIDEALRIMSQMDAAHIDRLMTEASASMVELKRILASIDEDTLTAIKHIGQSIDEDHTVDTLTALATHLKTIVAHIEQSAEVSVRLW